MAPRSWLAILATGIWVNASEFLRNEILVKSYWIDHYRSLGMSFPSAPLNGMVWVTWGFLFACALYALSRRFSLVQATLVAWFMGFVLMWVVAWNLNVLPTGILGYAIPLSLLETFVGIAICRKIYPSRGTTASN